MSHPVVMLAAVPMSPRPADPLVLHVAPARPAGDALPGAPKSSGSPERHPDAGPAPAPRPHAGLGANQSPSPTKRHPDVLRRLDSVFLAHHGVASRAQLLAAGATNSTCKTRVAAGLWIMVHRGVYRLAAAPVTDHGRLHAAVLAGGPHALASHRAAGWLWALTERPAVEITVPHGTRCRAHGVTVHRARSPGTASLRDGIPVTNPLRTMIDLAAVLDDNTLTLALDKGVAAGLFTPDAVHAELSRQRKPGRPGGPALARVLDLCGPISMRSPSVLQNAFARLLRRAGLPDAVPEIEVLGGRYRIDYGYPDLLLGFELEGLEFHRGPQQVSHDHARRRRLTALGWTILVFTPDDVLRHPDEVAADIRGEVVVRRASLPA